MLMNNHRVDSSISGLASRPKLARSPAVTGAVPDSPLPNIHRGQNVLGQFAAAVVDHSDRSVGLIRGSLGIRSASRPGTGSTSPSTPRRSEAPEPQVRGGESQTLCGVGTAALCGLAVISSTLTRPCSRRERSAAIAARRVARCRRALSMSCGHSCCHRHEGLKLGPLGCFWASADPAGAPAGHFRGRLSVRWR
jgi:hypothetical protein